MATPQDDSEHLNLLSLFHYVVAGLAALFSLFPVFHLVMGIGLVSGALDDGRPEAAVGRSVVGWLLIVFAVAFIVCGLGFAVCLALAGKFLKERRRYRFCLVLACIACVFMPFGTVLGVFTLLVLMRPPVKAAFGVG
jgi:hypothetical protein